MATRGSEGDRGRGRKRAAVDRSLRAQLFDDEQVVLIARPGRLATFPRFVLTLGLYAIWRRRDTSVLTDQRVLVGKGVVHRSERAILLSHVDDVTFARNGLNAYANLAISDRRFGAVVRIGPMSPRAAHRFARETLRRI